VLGSSVVGACRSGVVGCRLMGLAVVVWLLVLGGGSAWATTGHSLVGQIGGLGNADGQFGEPLRNGPAGVGVMPSTGEVFTVDAAQVDRPAEPRVQRFSADGVFQSAFALDASYAGNVSSLAVAGGGPGAVYVAKGVNGAVPSVVKYTATGVSAGEVAYELNVAGSNTAINGNPQVAVDPVDGNVYVTATYTDPIDPNIQKQVIDIFSPATGAFTGFFDGSSSLEGAFFCSPSSLAVDGLHRVYVLDPCKGGGPFGPGRVDRFEADGSSGMTVDVPVRSDGLGTVETSLAVAADPASSEVYVAHTGPGGLQVTHFGAGGVGVIYTFDASNAVDAVNVRGMAVGDAGTVYTSDATQPFVQRFARFDGPAVVTGDPPATPESRSAALEGTINPEGVASSYRFEYGTDVTYGQRSPVVDAGSGSVAVPAAATVGGLQPNKTYHYRLVGSNGSGSIAGADRTFTTAPGPGDVGSSAFASEITPRSVRLHGTVNPNNSAFSTNYSIEYGTTTAYGRSSGGFLCGDFVPCSGAELPVATLVSGLDPGTTYHFRVVVDNGTGGPQFGADQTVITAPAAGGGATNVTAGRATLTGTVNPHGVATSYHFNYGATASYGASTPAINAGSGAGDRLVTHEVSGLLPDTTYHVQVVATSADGTVRAGADGLFRTAPAPTAVVIGPTGVSTDAATLAGEVNTYGRTGSYHFDVWSLDSSYAHSTAERPLSGNASAERVGAGLTGLPAGETFVVQLIVASNDAIKVSDQDTFATAPTPRVSPISDPSSVYGCGSPRLDAYNRKPKPGEKITITGQDLGVGGNVVLGERSLKPSDWSAAGFKVSVPEDGVGTLALTVDCGRRSNTIAVAVLGPLPDNRFSITKTVVRGSKATVSVKVAGPGKLELAPTGTLKADKTTVKKPGTSTIKINLTTKALSALRRSRSGRLTVTARVRFTPAGGRPATRTVKLTFKRGGGR
jgi:hypothetical protein